MATSLDILNLLPECAKPKSFQRDNQLAQIIETKLGTLAYKLSRSPYQPYQSKDALNLNVDIFAAVYQWLKQFDAQHRLGLLAIALNTIYVTAEEFDVFLDSAITDLLDSLSSQAGRQRSVMSLSTSDFVSVLRPYPISTFGAYDSFVRRIRFSGTKERSIKPVRSLLEDLLTTTVVMLANIAHYGSDFFYLDDVKRDLLNIIQSLIDGVIVLVEDLSLSGTSIFNDLRRLLLLIDILFGPYEGLLKAAGHRPPVVSVLIGVATEQAVHKIDSEDNPKLRKHVLRPIVAGCVFDVKTQFGSRMPEYLRPLTATFEPQRVNVFASTRKALVYFYDRFAKPYWLESPGLAKRVGMSDEDCWYGFKRGGWPVVTYANAPNNSLPPLWYPDSRCDTGTGCRALFMRVESRDTGHGENSFDANFERIRELNEKKKDRSAEVLRRLYEDYLGV